MTAPDRSKCPTERRRSARKCAPPPSAAPTSAASAADVRPRRTVDFDPEDEIVRRRLDVETPDLDSAWSAFDLDSLTSERVQTASADLQCRDHWRDLFDRPRQRGGDRAHVVERYPGHVERRDDFSLVVECRGRDAEHDLADVALFQVSGETQQPRRPTEPQDEHAGGGGIERASVTDAAFAKKVARLRDDVVRRPAGRFVDDDDAVQERVLDQGVASSEPFGWRTRRRASSMRLPVATAGSTSKRRAGVLFVRISDPRQPCR